MFRVFIYRRHRHRVRFRIFYEIESNFFGVKNMPAAREWNRSTQNGFWFICIFYVCRLSTLAVSCVFGYALKIFLGVKLARECNSASTPTAEPVYFVEIQMHLGGHDCIHSTFEQLKRETFCALSLGRSPIFFGIEMREKKLPFIRWRVSGVRARENNLLWHGLVNASPFLPSNIIGWRI